ncbi:MAG TPA: FkbM family methyltransferase [Gemmataceae bacterium]|jgi:FkbM family methyltransferase|nr:FkbM family methyltransferase [Gemmataceae bacterium]
MSGKYAEHQSRLDACLARPHVYPKDTFSGRGIVICAGGIRYFTNAYVCTSILRMHGCRLPIQFWHLGPAEMTEEMRTLVAHLDVTCVDAREVRKEHPVRILNGWELKPFAMIRSPFEEVLLLDADNVVVRDPAFLFDTQQYVETGAIFWPDYNRLEPARSIWEIMGVDYRNEPEFESGQMVVDKRRCWTALQLTMHLNEWSDFYYDHIHGDKDTFHMAWRKIGRPYAMPERGIESLAATMCQHDFKGRRLFQHRNMRKWQLQGANEPVSGFEFEAECLGFLEELRGRWSIATRPASGPRAEQLVRQIVNQRHYLYCRIGHDFRPVELLAPNRILAGEGAIEHTWEVIGPDAAPRIGIFTDGQLLCELEAGGSSMLHGHWLMHEKMAVVLLPSVPAGATPILWTSQTGEDQWIAANVAIPTTGVFVEVGVATGVRHSNTYWLEQRGWTGLLVEADARNLPLIAASRKAPVEFCAAADQDGATNFVQHRDVTLSGCRRPSSDGTVVTVPTRRLDSLLAERNISHVDLMSIDTEGTELEVLAGLGSLRPTLLIVEHWTLDLTPTASQETVVARLDRMNYEVIHTTQSNLIARFNPPSVEQVESNGKGSG